jgi:hypothetical protein
MSSRAFVKKSKKSRFSRIQVFLSLKREENYVILLSSRHNSIKTDLEYQKWLLLKMKMWCWYTGPEFCNLLHKQTHMQMAHDTVLCNTEYISSECPCVISVIQEQSHSFRIWLYKETCNTFTATLTEWKTYESETAKATLSVSRMNVEQTCALNIKQSTTWE